MFMCSTLWDIKLLLATSSKHAVIYLNMGDEAGTYMQTNACVKASSDYCDESVGPSSVMDAGAAQMLQ